MVSREVRLPPAPSRSIVESYVARVLSQLPEDFAFAILVPWGSPQRPGRLLTPDIAQEGHFDAGEIASLMTGRTSLLVPCTLETRYEKRVVKKLLEQLESHSDFCVFLLQLLDAPGDMTREYVKTIMARHDALLALGANAVVLDPSDDPDRLHQTLEQEQAWFEANATRANAMISCNGDSYQCALEYHHELLWESVPKALMPGFPPIDRALVETASRVGDYRLMHRFDTRSGNNMLLAVRNEREKVVLKVFDKSNYVSAGHLECVYREWRFLRDVLKHPHIAHCSVMLHSLSRVYFALEFGGMKNMHQHLLDQPGYRLDSEDAVDHTMQIAQALAFCHSRDIVHRQVSLEHVVVDDRSEKPFCRLVDFFQATHCLESTPSTTRCGELPSIAPEVALDESYFAKPADCWSLGVVFLEAAGGLGSMEQAVGWTDDAEVQPTAARIRRFFCSEGNHARALAVMGGVQSAPVLAKLSALLQPNPAARATMGAIAPSSL